LHSESGDGDIDEVLRLQKEIETMKLIFKESMESKDKEIEMLKSLHNGEIR